MEEIIITLLTGLAAIIVTGFTLAVVAFKRTGRLQADLRRLQQDVYLSRPRQEFPVVSRPTPPPPPAVKPQDIPYAVLMEDEPASAPDAPPPAAPAVMASTKHVPVEVSSPSWEQRIGTRWILIAGIVTTLVGMGFFLKYAYDNNLIGPLGRVLIAATAGLLAVGIGEATRRRGYEVVAKGLTALGFGILYATVYGAYSFYQLISAGTGFGLSAIITAAAMAYAVAVNEMLAGGVALFGGYLAPFLFSTGENRAMELFSYTALLSVGAMVCAIFRRWRIVKVLAFVGSFILYTGWFEKFYRPTMPAVIPEQLPLALGWLSVFFVIFLVMPVVYEMIRSTPVEREGAALLTLNAAITFYYLVTMLYRDHRSYLALSALILAGVYFVLMLWTRRRIRADIVLPQILLALGLFFVTIAVPLYFRRYNVSMSWSLQSVVLLLIGLRYKNLLMQYWAYIALAAGCVWLVHHLPLHTSSFNLVLNSAFLSWGVAGAAMGACHGLYRWGIKPQTTESAALSSGFYLLMLGWFLAAALMEWYAHVRYNLGIYGDWGPFVRGAIVCLGFAVLLMVLRPLCPQGRVCAQVGIMLMAAGGLFVLAIFWRLQHQRYTIFLNANFIMAIMYALVIFATTRILFKRAAEFPIMLYVVSAGLVGIIFLWALGTEEIYMYWKRLGQSTDSLARCRFLGQMYISVMWAVYAAVLMGLGFWRKAVILRYVSLALFLAVLIKVFVFDMAHLKSVYRIAGFLTLGVILVAISYLYQYGKKKGFFDTSLLSPVSGRPPAVAEK